MISSEVKERSEQNGSSCLTLTEPSIKTRPFYPPEGREVPKRNVGTRQCFRSLNRSPSIRFTDTGSVVFSRRENKGRVGGEGKVIGEYEAYSI
jgi:hypothetical protein